jgi:hypothetical protein
MSPFGDGMVPFPGTIFCGFTQKCITERRQKGNIAERRQKPTNQLSIPVINQRHRFLSMVLFLHLFSLKTPTEGTVGMALETNKMRKNLVILRREAQMNL